MHSAPFLSALLSLLSLHCVLGSLAATVLGVVFLSFLRFQCAAWIYIMFSKRIGKSFAVNCSYFYSVHSVLGFPWYTFIHANFCSVGHEAFLSPPHPFLVILFSNIIVLLIFVFTNTGLLQSTIKLNNFVFINFVLFQIHFCNCVVIIASDSLLFSICLLAFL